MISVVIIVKDGERHLAEVLASVRGFAEILVLDSGSTDRTLEIARAAGARIESQPFLGYGAQKNRAVALAKYDWILSLDADEVLDPTARAAVAALDLSDPSRCWRLRRRTFVGAYKLRHGHLNDAPIRLFNRSVTRFSESLVHESVLPSGDRSPDILDGSILHYSFRDAADLVQRGAAYARLKAALYREQRRSVSAPILVLRAAAAFLKSYVLKAGFLDGRLGVVSAMSAAVDAVTALAMASEDSSRAYGTGERPG